MSTPGSSPGVSAQPRTPQGEGGDTGTAASEAQGAAERVTAWLDQFATLRGVDQSVAHVANLVPLLTSDLRTLVAAGFRRVAEDPATAAEKIEMVATGLAFKDPVQASRELKVIAAALRGGEQQ